jgi:hypothetical protein
MPTAALVCGEVGTTDGSTIPAVSASPSTVRKEMADLHSALEEAKADIVGLWALHLMLDRGLLPASLEKSMYVTYLAGSIRTMRFGLKEAHGKGQALQFNFLVERGGFVFDGKSIAVDFDKVRGAVEALCAQILTIQANGDKVRFANAARNIADL